MAIYAGMGGPEVWRYDGRRGQMHIYHLKDDSYVELPSSLAFPILAASKICEFLEQSKTKGQTATLRTLRKWLRESK